MVKSDSQLVTGQVKGEYQAKDLQLIKYLSLIERGDLLAKLASTQKGGLHKTVIQEALGCPTIEEVGEDPQEARRIIREATKYVFIASQLYRRGFSYPLLQCLGEAKAERAIKEVHEGACGSHIGGRALASKIARAGFYWLIIKKDNLAFSFTFVEHPQSNGQAKVANRVILRGQCKRIEEAKGRWVEKLP
ncbi:hypothetical protein CR513_50576, partial [Mucuna pruriens]